MNVACTACPAKYAVPDDRVRGKRARITCKHCGTSIVVDGSHLAPGGETSGAHNRPTRKTMTGLSAPMHSLPAEAPAAGSLGPPAPSSSGPTFRVALASGQQALSIPRIVELFRLGTITPTTYIWREGMPEWKPASAIPELAAALKAAGSIPLAPGFEPPEEETRVSAPYHELVRQQLAQQAEAARSASQAAIAVPRREEELFSLNRDVNGLPALPAPTGVRRSSPPSGMPATVLGNRPMRKTLPPMRQSMHSVPADLVIPLAGADFRQPAARSVPAPAPVVAPAPVAAQASAPPPPAPPPPMAPPPVMAAPVQARPVEFDTPPRSAAPVSVPLAYDAPPKRRTGTLLLLSAAIALTLGAGAFALFRSPAAAPPPAAAAPPPATPAPPPAPVAAPATPAELAAPAEPEGATASAPAAAAPKVARAAARASDAPKASRKKAEDDTEASEETAAEPAAAAEPAEAAPEKPTPDELAGNSEIADPPFDRAAASQALGDAASNAASCKSPSGPTGAGQATVTFSATGKVTAVSLSSEFAGTSAASCIQKIFKAAKVPAFSGDAVTVSKRFSVE